MARVVVLTGGNLGDVRLRLEECNSLIGSRVGHIVESSSVQKTKAWGFESEDDFLNQALSIDTELEPEQVMEVTQQIERELGRKGKGESSEQSEVGKTRVYTSREIDIDILFYDDKIINLPRLKIPHALMHQRDFVLKPLCEFMPEFVHPVLGKSVRQLRDELLRTIEK